MVLYRLGSSGGAASIAKIAFLFGLGDGGTIQNFTNRIVSAILKLKNRYIFWPGEERKFIEKATYHEMPFCIGYVDGTEVRLAEKPYIDSDSYLSRKQQYSIKAQLTVLPENCVSSSLQVFHHLLYMRQFSTRKSSDEILLQTKNSL